MPRVLVVTEHVPGRDAGFQKSGHGRYLQGFLDFFDRNGFETTMLVLRPKVDFVSISQRSLSYRVVGPGFTTVAGRITLSSFVDIMRCCAWHVFSRFPQRMKNAASGLRLRLRERRGFSHDLGRSLSEPERAYVRAEAERSRPDLVVFDGIFNTCEVGASGQRWIITHEVKYQRARSFADRGVRVSPINFDRESERAILDRVGNVIAIQWDDAREFRELSPRARVVVVPVAMDVVGSTMERRPTAGRCLFVGSGSFHNYDGIRWFLENCWNALRAEIPEVTLDIVGTVCFRLGDVPAGVTLRGVVEDLSVTYRSACVAIVPLRLGSGLKVKLVEALANGLPVVTTPIGAQGLGDLEPVPFAIADDASAFVRECAEILRSADRQFVLARAARLCADRFSEKNAFREFAAALASDAPA